MITMATKLEAFLTDQKIDHRRLLTASRQVERLRPEDRAIKLVQKQTRKKEDGKLPDDLKKPRSGRPVTTVGLARAMAGDSRLSSAAKARILRAVNAVLSQRKKDEVKLIDLFDPPPAKTEETAKE